MSNPVDNNAQTRLLFKQFMGVASTELDKRFDAETFNFVPNIFSKDVMIEDIPSVPPFFCNVLDSSGSWLDSSSNYAINSVEESTFYDSVAGTYTTFSQMFPTSNLKFYKRLSLVPVTSGSYGRVWGSFTDYSGSTVTNKNSVLEHAIPFKFDDINSGYLPIVRKNNSTPPSTNFQQVFLNSSPIYWLMDSGSGYLLFYASKTTLESNNINSTQNLSNGVQDPNWAPTISCFVYSGKTGITNLDVSGQIQVGDISNSSIEINNIKRMILLDGSSNILDLNPDDAIRTQYEYVRKHLFVGYPTQPIIDNSNVDHTQDPSLNNVVYELDVSGNTILRGHLNVLGHTQLVDISATNLDLSGNLNVLGHTQLVDVSCNNLEVSNDIFLFGDMSMNGGKINWIGDATDVSGVPSWGQVQDALGGGGGSFWTKIGQNLSYDLGEVSVLETNLVVKSDKPTPSWTSSSSIIYYEVAFTPNKSPVNNVSAYFTFTNNVMVDDVTPNSAGHRVHFLAGVTSDQNDSYKPYIKVLANNALDERNRLAEIHIVKDNGGLGLYAPGLIGQEVYLILGFYNDRQDALKDCELRMYKNGKGEQSFPPNGYDWLMGDAKQGITRRIMTGSKSVYDPTTTTPPWQILQYVKLNIGPSAYTTLEENFKNDVYISGKLTGSNGIFDFITVNNDLTVNNNAIVNNDLTVNNNAIVNNDLTVNNNAIINRNLTVNESLHVEVNSQDNSGVFIKNSFPLASAPGAPQSGAFDQCGFPSIKFQDNSLSGGLFPVPTFKEIVVGGQGPAAFLSAGYPQVATGHDDFNILLGQDDMQVTGQNSSGALSLFINNTSSGGAGINARCNNGDNVGTFTMGNNGNTEIISKSDGTNKGFQIGTQSERPESNWYIGSTNNMFAGKAITLTSTSETAGNFSTGEVRINKDNASGGPPSKVDFIVSTDSEVDALKVDSGNNTVNLNVPLVVSDISSTTGVIDVSADILNLPNNTIIKNRKYWSETQAAIFDLKVDGFEVFNFDTQSCSSNDWISIAWVGPPTIHTLAKQRASATFEFLNNISSVHQSVTVNVSCIYGTGLSIDVVKNTRFDDGGSGNNRLIKAFRIAYGGTYDGGIFQMQILNQGGASTDINLKITKNHNFFGWFCDLSGSPPVDNNPVFYNNGAGQTPAGTVGTEMPSNFPSVYGVNILDRRQSFGLTDPSGTGNVNDGKSTLFYTSDTVFNKVYISKELDLSSNDIVNVNTITSTNVYATDVSANSGNFSTIKQKTGNQLVIGDAGNFSTKVVVFRNMFNVYTNLTSRSSADAQLTASQNIIPNNYLIGYSDTNEKGGLIYRANMGSSSSYFNKLITTTSLGYFSTNYFRTIKGVSTIQSRAITMAMNVNDGIYKTSFFYTNNLITNPGHNRWYPGSPSYPIWSGDNDMGGDSNVNSMKYMQLPRDQFIRVLSFVFEGYNTEYKFRALTSNLATSGNLIGATVVFEIVFGFGNGRAFENNGPFSTIGSDNFIKCYTYNTTATGPGQTITITDLGLNTVYNHFSNGHTHNSKPIENKAIPTGVTTGSNFVYNDLYPMIFIRPIHGTTDPNGTAFAAGDPYVDTLSSSVLNTTNWELTVPSVTGTSGIRPNADLYHTCPFGAQFEFEHYIPAS